MSRRLGRRTGVSSAAEAGAASETQAARKAVPRRCEALRAGVRRAQGSVIGRPASAAETYDTHLAAR
jgi:hypothetical protein